MHCKEEGRVCVCGVCVCRDGKEERKREGLNGR